jgi:hypothetical protein
MISISDYIKPRTTYWTPECGFHGTGKEKWIRFLGRSCIFTSGSLTCEVAFFEAGRLESVSSDVIFCRHLDFCFDNRCLIVEQVAGFDEFVLDKGARLELFSIYCKF